MKKLLQLLLAGMIPLSLSACSAAKSEPIGGYLAIYPALYEPDMGVEYAQFPSKEYTDTYRTDVLYYAISKDGGDFQPLNNNKAVLSPQGCERLNYPFIFRKDGGYCLVAASGDSSSILVFDSDDLLYFKNQRLIELNPDGIPVKKLSVQKSTFGYKIYWQGGDGKSYITKTSDFEKFSKPSETDFVPEAVNAALPDYADKDEAFIFELTSDEYERINRKYSKLHSVSVECEDISISVGDSATLPKTVDVVYSDGSKTPMSVEWNISGLDLTHLEKGEYTVKGRITADGEYNSPLALYCADPYVVYDEDNDCYYFTSSNMNENSANGGGAYQSIVIRKADSINGITDAEKFEIWTDRTLEDGTRITGWYWAPEIHKIGDKWRIIALATVILPSGTNLGGRQCIFTCEGDDLTDPAAWEYTGYIHDANGQSVGSFDTTYFEYGGTSYYVTPKNSSIWITTVDTKNPIFPTGDLVMLSTADRAYETNNGSGKAGYNNMSGGKVGQMIEEASSVLIHDGKIFIAYAGCTVDMMYCVCLLSADLGSDLMDPESWTKYPYPILGTQDLTTTVKKADYTALDGTKDVTGHGDDGLIDGAEGEYSGTFGPGHNSFTVDRSGNPVIIYHARDWADEYPGATGSNKYGLVDPGRHAYARPVIFNYEGIPVCNLTAEEYLAENLRNVEIRIEVK